MRNDDGCFAMILTAIIFFVLGLWLYDYGSQSEFKVDVGECTKPFYKLKECQDYAKKV